MDPEGQAMSRRASTSCAAVLVAAFLLLVVEAIAAGVTSSVTNRTYSVHGTTARAVVRYMQSHAIAGDHGAAFANIRPRYFLDFETRQVGGVCRATDVAVNIRFTLTVPNAVDRGRMSTRVRRAWDSFLAFVHRHEDHHRQSYIGCARRFIGTAQRQSEASCPMVGRVVRRLFETMRRDCEVIQLQWDRGQRGVLRQQSLIRMSGY
jgi:predicted secreted Zn-dependent protease